VETKVAHSRFGQKRFYVRGKSLFGYELGKMVEQGIGTLDVYVFQGAGMVKMDMRGLCDPYVTVTITNSDGIGGKTKKTKHIRQNLNPEFNVGFSFPVQNLAQMLVVSAVFRTLVLLCSCAPACSHEQPSTPRRQIKVYDHDDLGSDDLMGSRSIPMQEVVEQDWQVRDASRRGP
jgi:Ca2+-dependent lipid-binding protein